MFFATDLKYLVNNDCKTLKNIITNGKRLILFCIKRIEKILQTNQLEYKVL